MRFAVGDIGSETSMEDILSSIKRIIAEEGDNPVGGVRGRKAIRTAQPSRDFRDHDEDEEILELDESVAAPRPAPRIERSRAADVEQAETRAEQPAEIARAEPVQTSPDDLSTILSARAAEATRGSLDQLSRMLVKPETPGADSLEGLVREMLRPMLRDWLDAKLPAIVETMVSREIARISGRE